jgi:hypothetical protein
LQQPFCADVIARIDRRDGLLLDCRNLWIVVGRRFGLFEQREMSRCDLTQLRVEVSVDTFRSPRMRKKVVSAVSVMPNDRLTIS